MVTQGYHSTEKPWQSVHVMQLLSLRSLKISGELLQRPVEQ